MSWLFIVFLLFLVVGLAVAIGSRFMGYAGDRTAGKRIGVGILVVAGLAFGLSTVTIVDTKNVGIVTEFGKPTDTLSNGWHPVAPWAKVTEWDGKLVTLRFSDTDEKDDGKGVAVRLGNQSPASIDLVFQYRLIDDAGVMDLFKQYGNEASLRQNLVQKSLQAAVNESVKNFDPIVALAKAGNERAPTVGMADLAKLAEAELKKQMPKGVEVVALTFVMAHYDGQTEDRIKAYNAAVQDTAIAGQREQTAAAIKRANDILASSNASPAVLYQNCLDMVERASKVPGGGLPEGFSCSAGGAVVIPATK